MNNKKFAVLSFSGGMDSSTLLLDLLARGYDVTAISFNYGQKHSLELIKAKQLVDYIQRTYAESNRLLKLEHQIITIVGLSSLLNSTLVEGGAEVPEGHYKDDNMKQTVVPNRNKIFSSIAQAIALSISNKYKAVCHIAMGIHAGDHDIYPDCRQEFRDADFKAFVAGNWDTDLVEMYTPYLELDKYDILKRGEECCQILGLNFDDVYVRTNTSYKPITLVLEDSEAWEQFSDYKSASSIERIEAFIKLGRKDPVQYADENGLVSWETVEKHAKTVLNIS